MSGRSGPLWPPRGQPLCYSRSCPRRLVSNAPRPSNIRYAVANRRALARFNLAQYRGEPPGIEIFHSRVAMCAARSPSHDAIGNTFIIDRGDGGPIRGYGGAGCKDVPPPQRSQTARRSYQPRLRMRAPDSKTRLILTCAMSVLCHALVWNPSPGRVAALEHEVQFPPRSLNDRGR